MNEALLYVRKRFETMRLNGRGRTFLTLSTLLFLILTVGKTYGADTPASSSAQERRVVSGIVVDKAGLPLVGVAVYESTSNGTSTDIDGRFKINVTPSSTLNVSYVGYNSQKIVVGNRTTIKVVMEEDTQLVEEVVVVGYGAQKKVSVTGAISSIQTKELKQSSSANLAGALAGRLPGLTTMQSSGQPGRDDVTIFLRGAATTNGVSPLILIDGVPREGMSTLDPSEIASVSILKDASATAVFGVRGANGVIMITTRRGTKGKTELSVSADFSMQSFIKRADRIHSWEFAELKNQAQRNSGIPEESLTYTPYMIDKYRSGEDRVFYPDRDSYSEIFRTWAPQSRFNVNMNGGSDKIQYFMNVGYLNQGGNFKTESKSKLGYDPSFKLDRYSFRSNVDYKIADNLKAFLNLGSYIEKVNTPPLGLHASYDALITGIISNIYSTPPTLPGPVTVEGHGVPAGEVIDNNNPAHGYVNRFGYRINTRTNLNTSFGVEWGLDFITKGLSTKGMVSYDMTAESTLNATRAFDTFDSHVARDENDKSYYTTTKFNQNNAISLNKAYASFFYLNLQYSINYARTFGKNDISALALVQRDNWEKGGGGLPYNMIGLSGRVTYAYDSRYLAEVNVGYNGSEQFAPKKRFGFFPAMSLGWIISNEKFLKDNKVITNLKLRASFGKVGNDKQGDNRFLYQDDFTLSGGYIPSLGRGLQVSQGLIGNKDLTWEIATKYNYGIDFQLWRELSISFDYFTEKRDRILISQGTTPEIQGVPLHSLPRLNMGKVDNKGYEVELTYIKSLNKDWSFTVKGNYAYNKNTQIFLDEAILSDEYAYRYRRTGYSIGQNFGYLRDFSNGNGYINTPEELAELPAYQIGEPRLGDFKYQDINKDGFINDKDMVPIGYSHIPQKTYGAALTVNYKGFDFSVLFQGVGNTSSYYTEQGVIEAFASGFYSGNSRQAWTPERYANGEEIRYPALSTVKNSNHVQNDYFIMDRSFVRLKNIELGYTLPVTALQPMGVNKLRVYVGGQNLYTWDNLNINTTDPEQSAAMAYPMVKMVNFGINIIF